MDSFMEVKKTYQKIAQQEISYRGSDISYEECLWDTIRVAACIISKGFWDKDDMIHIEHPEEYIDAQITMKKYAKFSYIKKIKLEAYGYLIEGVRILDQL